MKTFRKETIKNGIFGAIGGILSAACGAGGGMIIVPYLKKNGFSQKAASRAAVACILPISAISAAAYILNGFVQIKDCLQFIPAGLAGAFLGSIIINKISPLWLKIIFGGFMIYAGTRLILR